MASVKKAKQATETKVQGTIVDPAWPFPAPTGAAEPATDSPALTGMKEAVAAGDTDTKADDTAAIASAKEAQAKRDEAAKAEKLKIKEEKAAAKQAEKEAKAKERADKKADREARLAAAAEGREYKGSMLALADRVKSGAYVKGLTGQLHATDELGNALSGVGPGSIVGMAMDLLGLEDNPYATLNPGQQSMNLRNKLRGALKKGTLTIADINAYIERNPNVAITQADIEAKAKAKADKAAEREAKAAAAKAKKEAKPAQPVHNTAPEAPVEQVHSPE